MSGSDFLREATAELYGSDPGEFTERRTALASRARAAGDRAAAKEIAGLRKPTRPAWMINQLVRADPGVADRLAGLGDELRAAAAALDGAKIRELSQERRRLVDTLIRRTLQQAGERSPSASLREDLTATFGAALADPQVAQDLAEGTLLRAAHHAEFGTGAPELTLVPPPADATGTTPSPRGEASRAEGASRAAVSPGRGPRAARTTAPAGSGGKARAADEARAARAAERAEAAEEARATEEARAARAARAAEDRQRAIAEADQTLEQASRDADQAAKDEQDARDNVQALESRLDEAHRRVTEARRRARAAQSALQKARRAVARLTPARRGSG